MTKDEFKAWMNTIIRLYNADHNIDIAAVIINKTEHETTVIASLCLTHGSMAVAALARAVAEQHIKQVSEGTKTSIDDLAEAVLRAMPEDGRGN